MDEASEGFELLSDGTRLEILGALAERLRESPENPVLGFSDLRRAVGMRDSGNFNYHLGKLEGRFVTSTEEGYRIAAAGLRVVAAVITGAYGGHERLGPEPLGEDCPVCGGGLTATYEDGLVRVACPAGHEFRNSLPPGAVDDRGLEGVIDLLTRTTRQDLELALSGSCPLCYGRLSWSAEPPSGPMAEFETGCPRCGARVEVPAAACLLDEPETVAFFHDHGVDIRERPLWAPELFRDVTVSAEDDGVEVTIEQDGELLRGRLDGSLEVRELVRE